MAGGLGMGLGLAGAAGGAAQGLEQVLAQRLREKNLLAQIADQEQQRQIQQQLANQQGQFQQGQLTQMEGLRQAQEEAARAQAEQRQADLQRRTMLRQRLATMPPDSPEAKWLAAWLDTGQSMPAEIITGPQVNWQRFEGQDKQGPGIFMMNPREPGKEPIRVPGVQPIPPQLGGMGQLYGQVDPKAIAQAIAGGRGLPLLETYGRVAGPAVASILEKEYQFPVAKAAADYRAVTQLMRSGQTGPQLRLRQAVNAAYQGIDVIRVIGEAWNGGRFPLLNRAALTLARQGNIGGTVRATLPLGPGGEMVEKDWTPAELANALEGQITVVTSELANAYMGGGVPTDHALQLAEKIMRSDWQWPTLATNLNLAQKDLKIRANSIQLAQAYGLNSANMYGGVSASVFGEEPGLPVAEPNFGYDIPAEVQSKLADLPPGKYTGLDGMKYTKLANGVIRRGGM